MSLLQICIDKKFNAKAYATRDIHFVRLMFKAEWINKNYHFAKARVVNIYASAYKLAVVFAQI